MTRPPTPPERANHLLKTAWKPGQSGNPNGRPKGSRGKITEDFLTTLYKDFKKNGEDAIQKCRISDPSAYLKIVAGLVPKHFVLERPLDGLSDEELADILFDIRGRIDNASQAIDVTPTLLTIANGDDEGDDESD